MKRRKRFQKRKAIVTIMTTKKNRQLRDGLTTGTCAAAAAAAAVDLFLKKSLCTVSVHLPNTKETVSVAVHSSGMADAPGGAKMVSATVIKDAGDDPDITNGAYVNAQLTIVKSSVTRIAIEGGDGVGRVTRPGLPVAVGGPAINPVPRAMIEQEIRRRLPLDEGFCVNVVISVKDGKKLAQKTLNPRLGIVGGISILGTSGIVKPFSAKSYKDTIDICLKSASTDNQKRCVLSTGRRSERLAQAFYRELNERCFVQIADFFAYALRKAVDLGFEEIVLTGYFGKLCKWAMNMTYTHAKSGLTDFAYLSRLAAEAGLSEEFCDFVETANNARHIFESCDPQLPMFVETIGQKALQNAAQIIGYRAYLSICLWDFSELLYKQWEVKANDAGNKTL